MTRTASSTISAPSARAPDSTTASEPLNHSSLVKEENPLYMMLSTSLGKVPVPETIAPINGEVWPVMPLPTNGSIAANTSWVEFNSGPTILIEAFGKWIEDGKIDDTPKHDLLTFDTLAQNPPAAWPLRPAKLSAKLPLLFVASKAGDNGRRYGDHGPADVAVDYIPDNFWATSQIYLTDAKGNTVNPQPLQAGAEYYVAAIVGNSGNWGTGRLFFDMPKIKVRCTAQVFASHKSFSAPLPSLSNLDPLGANLEYEQYFLRAESWDVVGFRLNVDKVFATLAKELADAKVDLGGATPQAWLKDSHPSLKVRIISGETPNIFTPSDNAPLTIDSDPRRDRHIAQRTLAPFPVPKGGGVTVISWTNFIVAQAGAGPNWLTLKHALPADAFRLFLAMPTRSYESHVAKGGRLHGFDVIHNSGREVASKPFPDAVILRQTAPDARLELADHAREPFLGLSLGVEYDPAKIRNQRLSDVSVVHAARDGAVVGGFTLQPQTAEQVHR